MRVATYTDGSAPSNGSGFALSILVLTVLLGTGVLPTIATFAGGPFPDLVTPLWLVLYLAAFLGLMFRHGINWISWLVRYRILLVILLLGTIVSVSWSINAQVSAERVVHLLGSSLIAVFIGFSIPLLVTLRIFAVVLAVMLLASAAAAIGLPALGVQSYEGSQVWRGLFNSKNDLGFWAGAAVLLYITLSESFHSIGVKTLCYLMAAIALAVLALSQSATSLVATLVAGSLSLYLYIASRFQLGFIRMAFVAILFISLTVLAVSNIETSELVGRSGDLTGRGEVWRQVLDLIYDFPLTGVGYGSLWFPTDATIWIQQSLFDFTWTVYHAHNGLLHVASEIGIPLAMIALLMVAQQLIEIFYCQYERQQVGVLFVLAFAVAFLISNFSEARFLVTRELFWIFFISLPISMLRQINVVSDDMMSSVEGADSEPRPQVGYATYAGVPGKPWLGPLSTEHAVTNHATSTDLVATGLVDHSAAHIDLLAEEIELDLSTSTLSLTETDIDLGELVDATDSANETADTDVEQAIVSEYLPAEKNVFIPIENEPEFFDNDDTFDVDRYDLALEVDADWVNIDLEDDR